MRRRTSAEPMKPAPPVTKMVEGKPGQSGSEAPI
jgi:hypothetical protein